MTVSFIVLLLSVSMVFAFRCGEQFATITANGRVLDESRDLQNSTISMTSGLLNNETEGGPSTVGSTDMELIIQHGIGSRSSKMVLQDDTVYWFLGPEVTLQYKVLMDLSTGSVGGGRLNGQSWVGCQDGCLGPKQIKGCSDKERHCTQVRYLYDKFDKDPLFSGSQQGRSLNSTVYCVSYALEAPGHMGPHGASADFYGKNKAFADAVADTARESIKEFLSSEQIKNVERRWLQAREKEKMEQHQQDVATWNDEHEGPLNVVWDSLTSLCGERACPPKPPRNCPTVDDRW